MPAALNGFGLWNVLVLVLMVLAYGFPIAQFLIEPSPSAIVHRVRLTMSHDQPSDPHVLDQPWRIWSTVAIMGILLVGILLGAVVIPVVQGWRAGIDAYTAICRALGILPGSPAQPQPSTGRTPHRSRR